MKHVILPCNGLDKAEGSVAREAALRAAAATGNEIICPVLLSRAPARYQGVLADSSLIVLDGCSTRCASRLATQFGANVVRKMLVAEALKTSGRPLDPALSLGAEALALAQAIADDLVRGLKPPMVAREPSAAFPVPTEYRVVSHDKYEFNIPKESYLFIENDVWVCAVNGLARLGISDYMQQKLTDISYFDPPKTGLVVDQFGEAGNLESTKAVFEVISPVSGTIVAVNSAVLDNPGLVNEDPYGRGWLVEMTLTDWEQDRELLMDSAAYAEVVKRKAAEEQ
jgi:glycine cleavage system H protein